MAKFTKIPVSKKKYILFRVDISHPNAKEFDEEYVRNLRIKKYIIVSLKKAKSHKINHKIRLLLAYFFCAFFFLNTSKIFFFNNNIDEEGIILLLWFMKSFDLEALVFFLVFEIKSK
jgi:hypothetical protein